MRIVLEPGTWIFDTAGKPDFQAAYNAGYRGWSAYPTGRYRATQTMVDDALGVGLVIQWNQEGVGNEALQGYDGGRRMAEQAIPAIEKFGWRLNETPIVYSLTDIGITPAQMPTVREAYRACWDQSWAGGYGPLNVMYDLSISAPSNFVCWHWGGDRPYQDWPYIHCQQVYPHRTDFGVDYDHNYLLKPLTMWAGPGIDPPQPPKDDDMADFRHDSTGNVYQIANGYKYHLSGEYFYGVLGGQLGESGVVSEWGIYSRLVADQWMNAVKDAPTNSGIPAHSHNVTGSAS